MLSFTTQIDIPLDANGTKVRLTTAAVQSPVPETASFILDVDVYRDVELPKREDQVWDLIELMRTYKNSVFEKCITPATREMIV